MNSLCGAGTVRRVAGLVAWTAVLATLSGCRVDEHKNGDNENVKIATPFGGMSVKTDDQVVQQGVGLTVYPGATLVKNKHTDHDGNEHDNGAADVNLSFGSFHLGVKALSYTTQDAPEKVEAYYRKDLGRYGTVILCEGHHAVGTPTETQDGLSCSDNKHTRVGDVDMDDGERQLRAGSRQHQHVVSVEPQGSGTKFGLVSLDLPGHLGFGDDSDSKQ